VGRWVEAQERKMRGRGRVGRRGRERRGKRQAGRWASRPKWRGRGDGNEFAFLFPNQFSTFIFKKNLNSFEL
jgi:hypothetical protein